VPMRKPREPLWTRRRTLKSAGIAAASLLVPAAANAGEPGPSGPRILIAGDSMIAGGFGVFLERTLRKDYGYEVRRRGKSSTGLARPDFFDWLEEAQELVASGVPDVSVVMFGGNDVQGLYLGKGEWIRWHEPGWDEEYTRRINAFCDVLAPDGQYLYWVGLPIMRPDKFRLRVERVNAIYEREMAARSGATFVDTWGVLANAEGAYADRLVLTPAASKTVRVRAGDGIHLSPAGAEHLKAHVLNYLLPVLSLMTGPGSPPIP